MRKPQDITIRNIRAANKKIAKLDARVKRLEQIIKLLKKALSN